MDKNDSPKENGIRHFLKATTYSYAGLKAALRHEAAFRQEACLVALLTPLALYLGQSSLERAVLVAVWLLVLVVELLNSALEAVVDRIGPEHHDLAGRAKDLGSAAVFVSICLALMVWGLLLV